MRATVLNGLQCTMCKSDLILKVTNNVTLIVCCNPLCMKSNDPKHLYITEIAEAQQ